MNWISAVQIILFCFLSVCPAESVRAQDVVTRVILDTDISSDVDDAGAVAVLHALADQGDAQIIAMMVSSGDPWAGSSLDVLNTSFGRPDIPVGAIKDPTVVHVSKYTQYIAENFKHDLQSDTDIPDATRLYRKILSSQPDRSVTVVSIGYLSNLSRLLRSGADEYSSLDGKDLVLKKVKKLVCMGGQYPAGREWNFYQDSEASSYVVSMWPTPVIFCGFEIGQKILTGKALGRVNTNHPLRKAYQLYNNISDRQSWDQIAVLLAVVHGEVQSKYWDLSAPGEVRVDMAGNNWWEVKGDGQHRYMIWTSKTTQLSQIIDDLMLDSLQEIRAGIAE